MLVKPIMKKYTYKGKDGKDHVGYNYALQLDNGKQILINPVVIYKTDDKGNKTDEVIYDGRSDLSLISELVIADNKQFSYESLQVLSKNLLLLQ